MTNWVILLFDSISSGWRRFRLGGGKSLFNLFLLTSYFPLFSLMNTIWVSLVLRMSWPTIRERKRRWKFLLLLGFTMNFLPRELTSLLSGRGSQLIRRPISVPLFVLVFYVLNFVENKKLEILANDFSVFPTFFHSCNQVRLFYSVLNQHPSLPSPLLVAICSILATMDMVIDLLSRRFRVTNPLSNPTLYLLTLVVLSTFYIFIGYTQTSQSAMTVILLLVLSAINEGFIFASDRS